MKPNLFHWFSLSPSQLILSLLLLHLPPTTVLSYLVLCSSSPPSDNVSWGFLLSPWLHKKVTGISSPENLPVASALFPVLFDRETEIMSKIISIKLLALGVYMGTKTCVRSSFKWFVCVFSFFCFVGWFPWCPIKKLLNFRSLEKNFVISFIKINLQKPTSQTKQTPPPLTFGISHFRYNHIFRPWVRKL